MGAPLRAIFHDSTAQTALDKRSKTTERSCSGAEDHTTAVPQASKGPKRLQRSDNNGEEEREKRGGGRRDELKRMGRRCEMMERA